MTALLKPQLFKLWIGIWLPLIMQKYLSCVQGSGWASLRQLWAGCWTFWECVPPSGLDSVVLCCWTFGCLGRNLVESRHNIRESQYHKWDAEYQKVRYVIKQSVEK